MVIIILFVIIGFFIGFCMEADCLDCFLDLVMVTLLSISMALLFGLIGLCIALSLPADNTSVKHTCEIASLQDGSGVSGSFLVGCGAINNEMNYTFYIKESDSYRLLQVECSDAIVRYCDSLPRVEEYRSEPTKSLINWFAEDLPKSTYVIYVPKGTIKSEYNLDAK